MLRTILVYGAILAAGTFVLEWLQFRFLVRTHAVEAYVVLVAAAFLGPDDSGSPVVRHGARDAAMARERSRRAAVWIYRVTNPGRRS